MVRYTNLFESTDDFNNEEEKVISSDLHILLGLSCVASTSAEIESLTVHSIPECKRRLVFLFNEIKSGRRDGYDKKILKKSFCEKVAGTFIGQTFVKDSQPLLPLSNGKFFQSLRQNLFTAPQIQLLLFVKI